MEQVKKRFRPELLNRFDKVIVFKALGPSEIDKIVALQINDLAARLERQKLGLDVTEAARTYLAKHGFEPELGARPVRRLIQTQIEDPLAEGILNKQFAKGETVRVDVRLGKIVLGAAKQAKRVTRRTKTEAESVS